MVVARIMAFQNVIKIEKYIKDNHLIIGEIDYWNSKNYFLTEQYMIILEEKVVNAFKYSEIQKIKKEINYNFHKNKKSSDYLYIILQNKKEYKILINTNYLVEENYKDISSYLLKKNKNILVEENIVKINNHKL